MMASRLVPDETLLARLLRLRRRASSSLDLGTGLRSGELVVQVEGVGGEFVMLHCLLDALLPPIIAQQEQQEEQGQEQQGGARWPGVREMALYFDLDGRLNVLRLRHLVRCRAKNRCRGATELEQVVDDVCERILVFRVSSALHLLATLHSLEEAFFMRVDIDVRVVVLDSLISLHFLTTPTEPIAGGLSASIPRILRQLQANYNFQILSFKPNLYLKGDNEYLSKTWQEMVTHRLIVTTHPDPTPPEARLLAVSKFSTNLSVSYVVTPDRGLVIIQ